MDDTTLAHSLTHSLTYLLITHHSLTHSLTIIELMESESLVTSSLFTVQSGEGAERVTLQCERWSSPRCLPHSLPHSLTPRPVILFVHQYTVMGGSRALMAGMARAAAQCGYEAVTFDLRGAGDSSGRCSFRCKSEAGDARAVVAHLLSERVSEEGSEEGEEGGGRGVFLVGSSAGAAVAGSVLDFSPRVLGGLFVGYTWGWAASLLFGWAFHSLECSTKPKLFVVGTADEFTSMAQYEWRLRGLAGSLNRMEVIEGKNHFQIEAPVYDEFVVQQAISFLETITTTQGEVSE